MFLDKYLSRICCDIVYTNYNNDYLKQLDENNFKQIYNILEKYNLGCMEDIIIKYLELFEYDPLIVDKAMYSLILILGNNYIDIINSDLTILDKLLESVQNITFREFDEE